jgi:predicted permease
MMQDLRLACRQLAAHPGYSLVTVLTLALGIGANTAIFSIARGVLLRPLPYGQGASLVRLLPRSGGQTEVNVDFAVPEVSDYRTQSRTLAEVVEYHSMAFNLLGQGEPDRVATGVMSSNFYRAFGVKPILGRDFRPDDEKHGADPVLLLSYDYWRDRFGRDPGIVGQRLRMNDRPILVIGVLPPLPAYPDNARVFMPTSSCPYRSAESTIASRTFRMVSLFGRLRPGATVQQAQADIGTINARLQREYPAAAIAGMTVTVMPVREQLVGGFRPTLWILLGTVGLVLLLACANAANLTFARLLSRDKEVVVRAALGAGRGRLMRQLLTESVLVALLGGALGCLLAMLGLGVFVAFAHRFTPRADEIRIDGLVLLFSLAVSVAAGLASGWLPVAQALRHNLAAALRDGAGRSTATAARRRFRDLMVAAQVALSLVLLIGAGLMVRSLVRLVAVDPGFRPERVLTAMLDLPFSKYGNAAQIAAFFQPLLQQLAADPAVVAAAVSNDVPLEGGEAMTPTYRVEGQPTPAGQPLPRAALHVASEDYLRTLGVPLMEGRGFTLQDDARSPLVAIVNRELARQWWPGRSAVGRRLAFDLPKHPEWRTVVGVVADVRQGLSAQTRAAAYLPFQQLPGPGSQIFVRTRREPAAFLADLRAKVAAIDPEQPVANVETLEEVYSSALAPTRLTTILLSLFAALALVITAIGIGAAVSFAVAERRKEVAIRMALGADGGSVRSLLFRRAMGPVLAGLAAGLAAAYALTRALSGLLFGVQPTDPLSLSAALLVLLGIGAATCILPSWRAARVDPATQLKA